MTRTNPLAPHFGLLKPFVDFALGAHKGLEPGLANLVDIRASQLNGCA